MVDQALLPVLEKIFATDSEPDAVFREILPTLGDLLQCHRCFLYLRNPQTQMGKIAYCWLRSAQYPDVTDAEWKEEPKSLPQEDPLFAAALRAEDSIFVEDVEIASPEVVNVEFERTNFGHRALIHAHLRQDGQLWAILQPCMFGQPRVWTDFDRLVITQLESKLAPLAVAYVKEAEV